MARPLTGQIVTKQTRRGTAFAVRIWAHGKRHYFTVGYSDTGWTAARARHMADRVVADIRTGRWEPPDRSRVNAAHRRARPDLGAAYTDLRRAAQRLDAIRETTTNAQVRLSARAALDALYRAEDEVGRALRA